uniref:Uncharacterized protein n=1 Tax=Opuntia streptacantha TaxID=393608 RepID=A0A7C9DB24_OPUST
MLTFVPALWFPDFTYPIAMFFLRQGLNPPLVISPMVSPFSFLISLWLLAGGPTEKNPTRLVGGPSAICFSITSAPRKPPSALLLFPIAQVSPASTGVMCCSRSLPYRQSPASSRRLSRAPNPVSLTFPSDFSRIALARSTAYSLGTEISKPSSPVYPVLVR